MLNLTLATPQNLWAKGSNNAALAELFRLFAFPKQPALGSDSLLDTCSTGDAPSHQRPKFAELGASGRNSLALILQVIGHCKV